MSCIVAAVGVVAISEFSSLLRPAFATKRRSAVLVTALLLVSATAVASGALRQPSIAEAAAPPPAPAVARPAAMDLMRAIEVDAHVARTSEPTNAVAQDGSGPGDLPLRRRPSPLPVAAPVAASVPAPVPAPAAAAADPVAPAATVSLVALPLLYADVWNAEERYFAISGATPDQLIASAKASIPADPHGDLHDAVAHSAPVVWEHVATYVIDPASGACTMTGVATTAAYHATIPQWTSPSHVAPELLAWWQVVLEQIRQHEGHHISIYADFVSAFPSRVAGQSCDAWVSIATQWSADLTATHAAFDAAEASWVFPSYAGPP